MTVLSFRNPTLATALQGGALPLPAATLTEYGAGWLAG
jgi:hypothetical protein